MLRRFYAWILAKAAHLRAEWWLAFFAFADGGLFPFPPHPLLALMCLAQPRRALRYAAVTTVFSLLGGSLGYAIGHFLYHAVGGDLLHVLHLAAKFPKAACYLRAYGTEIIIFKAATPIPFMLLTITAGFIAFPYGQFLLASVVSRGVIFCSLGLLFRVFGAPIKSFIDRYFALVVAAVVVVIASGYLAVSLLGGGGHHTADACARATLNAPAGQPLR